MDSVAKNHLKERVLTWWRKNKKDYPWRQTHNPYKVLVSEMLLQQTRAETVIYYYNQFIQQFPNWQALANADDDALLKCCENIGYYRRVHALKTIARRVLKSYRGKLPKEKKVLLTLPGVGDYTASAICCFAFGQPEPAVDGNLKRVISRLFAIRSSVDKSYGVQAIKDHLKPLLEKDASSFQQALMDIGSTICLPRRPRCCACPLQEFCRAFQEGAPTDFPVKKRRSPPPEVQVVAGIAVDDEGKILLTKRKKQAFLGGLWEFPGGKIEPGETREKALAREFREEVNLDIQKGKYVGSVLHAYTHLKVVLHIFEVEVQDGDMRAQDCERAEWLTLEQVENHPLTAGTSKALKKYLESKGKGGEV